MASGALDDVSTSSDSIQAELDRVALGGSVEAELAAMKTELGPGVKTLGSGSASAEEEQA
jgi:hypothetical protein